MKTVGRVFVYVSLPLVLITKHQKTYVYSWKRTIRIIIVLAGGVKQLLTAKLSRKQFSNGSQMGIFLSCFRLDSAFDALATLLSALLTLLKCKDAERSTLVCLKYGTSITQVLIVLLSVCFFREQF